MEITQKDNEYLRGVEIVTGAIIEDKEGKILIAKSPKWNNKWVMPGGHIEPGETIKQAAKRETEEETGLIVEVVDLIVCGELIGSKDFHRPAHFIFLDVYCRVIGGDLKLDKQELTDYQWLSPEEALKLDLAESYESSLNKFIDYKKG